MSKLNQQRRGAALIPAVMCVMTVAALSTAYLSMSLDRSRESRTTVDNKRAFYVAEAGLAEAFYGISKGSSGAVASPDQPAGFGGGLFWVEAQDVGNGRVALRSTGLAGSGRASLSITLQKNADALGRLGLFSDQDLVVQSGALLDSYDSETGPYVAPNLVGGLLGEVGVAETSVPCAASNGNITLGGSPGAKVIGNATPGPAGNVVLGRYASVSGAKSPAENLQALSVVEVPEVTSSTSFQLGGSTSAVMPPGDYGFTEFMMNGSARLEIRGPTQIVIDQLVLQDTSSLYFNTNDGPITVWVRDAIDCAAGTRLDTSTTDTSALVMMLAADGPAVQLASTGLLYGMVYAPQAQFTWPASLELFGSIAAKSLTVAAGAKLHYDRALSRAAGSSTGVPELVCWRVMELPNAPLVTMKFDPMTVLKINSVTPMRLDDAHISKEDYLLDAVIEPVRTWVLPKR